MTLFFIMGIAVILHRCSGGLDFDLLDLQSSNDQNWDDLNKE